MEVAIYLRQYSSGDNIPHYKAKTQTFESVARFLMPMSPNYKLAIENFHQPRRDKTRVLIAEIRSSKSDWTRRKGLPFFRDISRISKRLEELLSAADRESVDLVVFPELSVPTKCLKTLVKWSKK